MRNEELIKFINNIGEYRILEGQEKQEILKCFIKNILNHPRFSQSTKYSNETASMTFDRIKHINKECFKITHYGVAFKPDHFFYITLNQKTFFGQILLQLSRFKGSFLKRLSEQLANSYYYPKISIEFFEINYTKINLIKQEVIFHTNNEELDKSSPRPKLFTLYNELNKAIGSELYGIKNNLIRLNEEAISIKYNKLDRAKSYESGDLDIPLICLNNDDIFELEKCHLSYNRSGLKEYINYKKDKAYISSIIEYCTICTESNIIELLFKIDLPIIANKLLEHLLRKHKDTLSYNKNATSAYKIFNIPKILLRQFEEDFSKMESYDVSLRYIQEWINLNNNHPLNDTMVRSIANDKSEKGTLFRKNLRQLDDCLYRHNHNIAKIYECIINQKEIQDSNTNEIVKYMRIFNDYANMTEEIGGEYKKYPKDLGTAHDEVTKIYKIKKDKIIEDKFNAVIEKNKYLEFEDKEFAILIPNKIEELIKEGRCLNHCVASYTKKIAREQTIVLFLRQKKDLLKPFYTIELKNNIIEQIHGVNNKNLEDKKILNFIHLWAYKHEINVNGY